MALLSKKHQCHMERAAKEGRDSSYTPVEWWPHSVICSVCVCGALIKSACFSHRIFIFCLITQVVCRMTIITIHAVAILGFWTELLSLLFFSGLGALVPDGVLCFRDFYTPGGQDNGQKYTFCNILKCLHTCQNFLG